ncbi:MAG: hypothetical protein FWE59_04325 [Oscillospiraceae bacterium]|nr:hypothetical protein [Oscillospiraceae bacterium]
MKNTTLVKNHNLTAMLFCIILLLLCTACGLDALPVTVTDGDGDGEECNEVDSPAPELTTPPTPAPSPAPIPNLTLEYQPIEAIHVGALHPTLQSLLDCEDREAAYRAFGEPDGMFRKYFYFSGPQAYVRFNENGEGWSMWTACTRSVHSILLAGKFDGAILPGVYIDSSNKEIVAQLGQPQFASKDPDVFGYKTDGFYIFFSDGYGLEGPKRREVTIYRHPKYDETKLPELLPLLENVFGPPYPTEEAAWSMDDHERREEEIQRVIDFCKTAWPDFDHWFPQGGGYVSKHSSRKFDHGVQYAANGFIISGSYWPILDIYGNYEGEILPGVRLKSGSNVIEGLAAQEHLEWHLDKDLMFELEKERLEGNKTFKEECYDNAVLSPDGKTMIYIGDQTEMDESGVCLWFLDGRRAPVLWDEWQAYNFFWLDNRFVIYNHYKNEHALVDTHADHLWEYNTGGQRYLDIGIWQEEYTVHRTPILAVDRAKHTITFGRDGETPQDVPYSIAADDTVIIGDNFFSPKASIYREGSIDLGIEGHFLYDEYTWLDSRFIAFINTDGFLSVYDTSSQRYYTVDIPSQNGKPLGDAFVSSEDNSLLVEPIELYLTGALTTRTATMAFTVAIPSSSLPVITLDGTACPLRPWG